MNIFGLFAGIGGIELGLHKAGHQTIGLVEIDEAAQAVLRVRFPKFKNSLLSDVRDVESAPPETQVLAAGFPCQDLSQAGQTNGIHGKQSGLVGQVFRLAKNSSVPWLLMENVPFMLQLRSGEAMCHILDQVENLGYRWAYRTVDSRAFGLPQRRERVFLIASLEIDPVTLLFHDNVTPTLPEYDANIACGFYWTEGTRGLGWAVDAIPTLKGGSTIGIPSPPAIWLPSGEVVTPDIRDAERFQGFEPGWTEPAGETGCKSYRWKLVGNAVSVPVAEWVGKVLSSEPGALPESITPLKTAGTWPTAAFGKKGERFAVDVSTWPVARPSPHLATFLQFDAKPLSRKATEGFTTRLVNGGLRYRPEILQALNAHIVSQHGKPILPKAKPARSKPRPTRSNRT
jgi:DNA (cytosine-5)-methyltransferase 1